jgi:hypothetical protein
MSTQQVRFWKELVQLRAHIDYLSLYRLQCDKVDRGISMLLAVASSGSIAAWAVWREFAMLWGAVIAISQVLSAVRSYLPFEKRLAGVASLASRFESLFVRWEAAWQQVASGELKEEQIAERLFQLKRAKIDIQEKVLKDISLPDNPKFQILAAKRAELYFATLYPTEVVYEPGHEGSSPSDHSKRRESGIAPNTSERTNASSQPSGAPGVALRES